MSVLTGQQIKDTYPGLLNLATATTGITSTPQQIQDGLGNNTNTRISTSGIISPNVITMNNLKPDYSGPGFTTSNTAPIAGIQNKVLYLLFSDIGNYSYSAISYNVITATTTSDVVTMAFYSLQQVPLYGVAPLTLIQSGITLTTNSIGVKTTTLPSTLSFSGTGGGFYVAAFIISNSGVTPTIRLGGTVINTLGSTVYPLGLYLNTAGTSLQYGSRIIIAQSQNMFMTNLTAFQTSFSQSDISTNLLTTSFTSYGFGLKTI